MNHGVAYWKVVGEGFDDALDQLTSITNALIDLWWDEVGPVEYLRGDRPRIYFTDPGYPHVVKWHKKHGLVVATGPFFSIVVSSEPLTTEEAKVLCDEFFSPIHEEEEEDGTSGDTEESGGLLDQDRPGHRGDEGDVQDLGLLDARGSDQA